MQLDIFAITILATTNLRKIKSLHVLLYTYIYLLYKRLDAGPHVLIYYYLFC